MRDCRDCKVSKDESEFEKNKTCRDGLRPACNACLVKATIVDTRLRVCRVCKQTLELSSYCVGSSGRVATICNECGKRKSKAYAAAQDASWRAERAAEHVVYRAKLKEEMGEEAYFQMRRAYTLEYEYGLTSEDFDRLLAEQGGGCGICDSKDPQRGKGRAACFLVDHDHTFNHVRGLLCMPCNTGLGFYKDSAERIGKSILYIQENPGIEYPNEPHINVDEGNRYSRSTTLKYEYGITLNRYEMILESQGGVCKLCGTAESGRKDTKNLEVDHNPDTGLVRGVLCHPCNAGIGAFRNDPVRMQRAILYLDKHAPAL